MWSVCKKLTMIRSMLLNGRATLAKADAMGLSVLLVFTVIVSKSMLQHILLNNQHCVLYHHATKVAYTACKRVRKVLSGTLDKVKMRWATRGTCSSCPP
ncbi:hypothetical protein DPEC_G00356810 [Dallia pectoralis]|uniref:Uncharacterized protein n=1 Tax=Dallia pectoralis TaxID=75939 RepID=A0ACC2F008_DALPE|nr:hypothetical protein DPEC_G00356810 [Dallia pectoralis]